ncbi:hypothetical protein, partial [Escherichia coli]|uniref:hypothetical protein n=1 Tax=Escherichia coli TaxID=562 RepID=UPI001BC916A1
PHRGSCVHFEGNGAKSRHSYPESIRAIQFNRRFRSYGAKVVLKKHPFYGVFLKKKKKKKKKKKVQCSLTQPFNLH